MKNLKTILLLIVVGIAVWSNSVPNGFIWDDEQNIQKNEFIKHAQYLPKLFLTNQVAGANTSSNQYRPILMLTFFVEYHIAGLWAPLYHFDNAILHIANSILVLMIVGKLLKLRGHNFSHAPNIALAAGLLFLVHPMQTEAVSYIAGRTDLLSAFFMFICILLYISDVSPAGSIIAFFFALLSKEPSIILPFILLSFNILLRRPFRTRQVFTLGCMGIISMIYVALRLTVFNFGNTLNFYGRDNIYTTNIPYRIYTFLSTIPRYLKIIIFPKNLFAERILPIITTPKNSEVIFGFAVLFLLITACIMYRRRNPLITLSAIWIFFTMLFSTNILVPVNAIMAEHWLYTPSIGIFLILTIFVLQFYAVLNRVARTLGLPKIWSHVWVFLGNSAGQEPLYVKRVVINCILAVILSSLSYRTIVRNRDWHDPITFYLATLKFSPDSARVHNNLAMAYAEENKQTDAITQYKAAIALRNEYPQTHHNLANSYKALGKDDLAISEYRNALKINGNFLYSYTPLIDLLRKKGQTSEAEEYNRIFQDKLQKLSL